MTESLRHYRCPMCGRLCSVPWAPPVWCLHHDSIFTPHGPQGEGWDPGWACVMDPFDPASDAERYRRELDAQREQILMLEDRIVRLERGMNEAIVSLGDRPRVQRVLRHALGLAYESA